VPLREPGPYISIAKAARIVPGGPYHPATLSRWITTGAKLRTGSRLRLRATRTPAGWVTTADDVEDFFAALTADRLDPLPAPAVTVPTPATRTARQRRVARELDRLGF
jgi:hypothetical protein